MRSAILAGLLGAASLISANPIPDERDTNGISRGPPAPGPAGPGNKDCDVITPKVFIISMFDPEADIWYKNANTPGSIGNLLAKNITVPGFSPLFPQAHCLADGSVCQLTTGESEINAASTITALMLSPLFNLQKTYFMVAGIAGINPKHGTIADVAFSKYAIQVALQYEFDARELPAGYNTGYIPLGATYPDQYPVNIYGTEVYELNEALRDMAVGFAKTAKLNDSSEAKAYRAHYTDNGVTIYKTATKAPGIITCDVATSDVYYSGTLLGEAFENTTTLFTNGSGVYCMTAQEDNATLEAMVRAAIRKTVDFTRIIVMRTGSDFDRPYPGQSNFDNLLNSTQGAFTPAIANIYLAGTPVVKGILSGWNKVFEKGVKPKNYVGDIFATLGGTPDFGPYGGPEFGPGGYAAEHKLPNGQLSRRGMYEHARRQKGALGAEAARRAQAGRSIAEN